MTTIESSKHQQLQPTFNVDRTSLNKISRYSLYDYTIFITMKVQRALVEDAEKILQLKRTIKLLPTEKKNQKAFIIVKAILLINLLITTGVLLQYLYSILQQCILKQNCPFILSPSSFLGKYILSAMNQIPEIISMFVNFLNSTIHLIIYNL